MKEKIKDVFEIQWVPAIVVIMVLGSLMLGCFSWTISRIDQHSVRTDRLYEMFIDLVKVRGK